MANEFRGTGNVSADPVLKNVLVNDEERYVAELNVFFDEYRRDGRGGFDQVGGFWMSVNVWGESLAAEVAALVKKGARVHVVGKIVQSTWTVTATGEERRELYVNADRLFLGLARVQAVTFMAPREVRQAGG